MSIIAVEGLNTKISLFQVVKMLGKSVQGQFEALHFVSSERIPFKTCYLRLSAKLDPVEVVERINNMGHGKKKRIVNAFIPETVPDFPAKPLKLLKYTGLGKGEVTIAKSLAVAHMEIMMELQFKYTGLYGLSLKGSHTLLEAIGMTVQDRLKQLTSTGDEELYSPFLVTGRYRKAHPHFGDFQLILGTLHRLEDAAGAPRTQLQESELTVTPKDINVLENVSYTKAQEAVTKYTDGILGKLQKHVSQYDLTENPEDSKEDVARKNVQTQLTKMMPYLPAIMKQVVTNHFAENSRRPTFHRMRMYGEPYLPGAEVTGPLLKEFFAHRVSRWKSMYNLLVFDVPFESYSKIMALNGKSLGGAKLIVRSSNVNIYRVPVIKKWAVDDDDEVDYSMEQ